TLGAGNPSLSAEQIRQMADATVLGGIVVHASFAIVYVWLGGLIGRGRRWARIVTTAALVIGAGGGLAFVLASGRVVPSQRAYIVLEQATSLVLRLAALWLLWVSPSVGAYLSAHSASSRP